MRATPFIATFMLVSSSCVGTETDNPLVDYDHSGCKNHDVQTALVLNDIVEPDAGAADRYCFAWQAGGDGSLHIDVINYPSGCAIDFSSAEAVVGDGSVALTIQRASCLVARCGSCRYDLAFDVRGVQASGALALALNERNCDGEAIEGGEMLTLPIDTQREGRLCRSLDSNGAFTLE